MIHGSLSKSDNTMHPVSDPYVHVVGVLSPAERRERRVNIAM